MVSRVEARTGCESICERLAGGHAETEDRHDRESRPHLFIDSRTQTTAKGARGLKNVETMGMKMDPYLKLVVAGQVFRTKVATDAGTSAHWDECFRVLLTGAVDT